MIMKPDTITFSVGSTVYKQPLKLTLYKDTGGRMVWSLHREQVDQRDDSAIITGLTKETILMMAEAVKSV